MDEMLNTQSWRNLETLLSKAGMYTQFLTEQLSKFDENLAGSAEQVRGLRPFEAWHMHCELMLSTILQDGAKAVCVSSAFFRRACLLGVQVREQAAEDADAERKGKRKAGSGSRGSAKKVKKDDGVAVKAATQVCPQHMLWAHDSVPPAIVRVAHQSLFGFAACCSLKPERRLLPSAGHAAADCG